MKSSRFAVPILLMAAPASAPALAPPPLQPTGKWTVNFADQQCLASRTYRLADGELVLGLRPSPTGNETELILALSHPTDRRMFSGVQVRLDGKRVGPNGLNSMPESGGRLAYRIHFQPRDYAQLLTSRTLAIQGGLGSFSFDLTAIGSIGRSLAECNADLLERWGLSREQQALQASFPEPADEVKFSI